MDRFFGVVMAPLVITSLALFLRNVIGFSPSNFRKNFEGELIASPVELILLCSGILLEMLRFLKSPYTVAMLVLVYILGLAIFISLSIANTETWKSGDSKKAYKLTMGTTISAVSIFIILVLTMALMEMTGGIE